MLPSLRGLEAPGTQVVTAAHTGDLLRVFIAPAPECDAAIARLRAAGNLYQTVEIEGRKTRAAS